MLNKIRNKYLSIISASLILFISCTNNQEISFQNTEKNSVESVVRKHIEKMSELAYIIRNEENIDLSILEKSPRFFDSKNQLKKAPTKPRIANIEKVTILLSEIQENINTFITIYDIQNNFSESEINKILSTEISKQLNNNEVTTSMLAKSSPCKTQCHQNYWRANSRCERNWYIGVAGLVVSGFFTLGTGTIIGAGLVGTMLLVCENDSQNDRGECLRNCNGGGNEDEDPRVPTPF